MTEQKIIKGNISIAKFLGWKKHTWAFDETRISGHWYDPNTSFGKIMATGTGDDNDIDGDLKFHRDWNWLMPVVIKISGIKYPDFGEVPPYGDYAYPRTFGMLSEEGKPMFRFNSQQLVIADTLIEATWTAVVEFIKWWNETNQQSKS